jgi:uncharacterized membrane protein
MPILLLIIAVALHFWLGWSVWLSVLVSFGGQTVLAILHLTFNVGVMLPDVSPREKFEGALRLILRAIGGAIIGMVLAYIPMAVFGFMMGHPSW